ncbi:uncharacterized protein LOC123534180 [Mercenaria mercenaria]|uniref:uncharacterized protein LOC123534180 n=1 Tax=Mercenaria mercenaria TaxID=6596 RepID=UPI00234E8208|nr:uncharacterized protein LOC123534180 [Mercenaria mercenaria]
MSGPRPFRSVEEAYAFVKSHEIATNNKYVVAKSKGITTQDLSSLESYKIQWEYASGMKAGSEKVDDGIPFINLGIELRNCQFGPPRKRSKTQPTEDSEDTSNQEVMSGAEKNQPTTGSPVKKRRAQPSKKLNCLSQVKIKKIMKFPEYAVEVGKEYPSNFKSELGKQLKANFSEDTKRYILVYVHIDNDHNHETTPIEEQHKHKKIVHVVDKGCTRLSGVAVPNIVPKRGPLLKKWASLKGKNLMDLAMQFKTTFVLPAPLAQAKPDQKLENMGDQELLSLYHDITGEMPNNMFSIANKEFTTLNLRLLLHLCIMFANAACDASRQSQVHPSVRIKGTESNFTPVQCLEIDCAIVDPHMHCPFCAKTDSYTDPSLLKTHYTNRHVNKAIEFAGLRILRCYDICEVAGKNKGCKTFKGGHWHCYKCPNGLDKRNSVYAHYQSHLKNYESSFQIQVAQDVNPSMCGFTVPHEIDVSHVPWESYNTSASLNTVSTTTRPNSCSSSLKRSYADTSLGGLETIDHTAMYVQDDGIGNVTSTYNAQEIPTTGNETYVITVPDSAELAELKARVQELEMSCKELEKQKAVQKSHIELLQKRDADQTKLVQELKLEKQNLVAELDTQKSEIEKLKSTQKTLCQSAEKNLCSSSKNYENKSQKTGGFEQVPRDVDVSLNKAKELEKSLKNHGKDTPVPGHSYGTRRATRKFSTRKSSDHTYINENLSKHNRLTLTGSQTHRKISADSRTSQPTTMEEMCNQLSSMREEIELLKQTSLGGSAIDIQHVSKQPLEAQSSKLDLSVYNSIPTGNSHDSSSASFAVPSNSHIAQNMQNYDENMTTLHNTSIDNNLKNSSCAVSVSGNDGTDVPGSLTSVRTGWASGRAAGNVDDLCAAARILESSLPSDC